MTTFKSSFSALTLISLSASAPGASVFISEFHYDNAGGDVGETVEIYIEATTVLADVTVTLYNGNGGGTSGSESANDMIPGGTIILGTNTYNIYTWNPTSIQNGAPDGIAVDVAGVLCDFISYEGVMTATSGPASGSSSVDVGVTQGGSTSIGSSIELTDSGWVSENDGSNTFGTANPALTAAPVPEPSTALLAGLALLGIMRRHR